MTKKQDMQKIENEILAGGVCAELADGANQLVFGDGSLDAEVVFIGEAPGRKEDEIGLPFMGAAGKFLNIMLESIGLNRDDVYITNIVKYRPPNNRDPSQQEKEDFWPYLVRQLNVIKPKLVVTLGRHSMEYFLPNKKIGDIHGKSEKVTLGSMKQVILPLYHPAAALYNGGQRQTLMDDFAKIPAVLKQI